MATNAQVTAEMEERGYNTILAAGEDARDMNEIFDAIKCEMELETFEVFKDALKNFFNMTEEEKIKIAAKLHDDFLAGDQEDLPYLDDGFPVFTYKGFCITVENAVWTFEDDEQEFTHRSLLGGLYSVDLVEAMNDV